MKQILYILGLTVLLSGIYTSCKTDTLDALREAEIVKLDKYIKDNDIADTKDVSGIYFKITERGTDTTMIRSGFKVLMNYKISLLDGTVVFTNEDEFGHHYEEYAFYVDVSNDIVNQSYVQQIAGLHKGLKKMHIGDTAFMVIPSELAFKAVDNYASFGVPRFSTLLATVYAKKGYSPEQQQQ